MAKLRMFAREEEAQSAFLDGRVGYAVGDIHGRADLLDLMIAALEARVEEETRPAGPPIVVFLGDYVDRGRQSAQVLDLLLEGRPHGYERRCLWGNHEQAMLAFLDDPVLNRAWARHGGAETMQSYGVASPSIHAPTAEEEWIAAADALRAALPQAHLDFIGALERYVVLGDYLFVHAGVDPTRTLEEQTDDDLYWSRSRFLDSRKRFSHRVVHGHTPTEQPFVDARRIGVDTGAYASGVLTAVRLEGEAMDFLTVEDQSRFRF